MHGGETAPGFNAPPSLCWSLRGLGPHPGGSRPQHPPALCMCCCCCFGCFGPRHRAAANQGGGKRRVQRGSWTPRTASAVAQAGGQGLLFHLRAAIGIHTQIPFPCMGIRAARSPVFCPCCAWGAMVSPAEPSCNVEHKRSALHRWLGLGLLPTPPLQTVPKLALVLSRSSRGQEHRMHTAALGAPRFAAWASGASAVLASHTKGIQNKQQKAELICAWRMQRISPLFATDR